MALASILRRKSPADPATAADLPDLRRVPPSPRAEIMGTQGNVIGPSHAMWQLMAASESASGQRVTIDSALQLSTVWSCIRLLSETVSTLPLKVYRRKPGGGREVARDHPLSMLLSMSPNHEMTSSRFISFIVASMSIRGNAFIELRRIGSRIVSLDPMLPQFTGVRRDERTGRLLYDVYEPTMSATRTLQADSVLHIRGFGLDGVLGLQPMTFGRQVIGAATAANDAAAKVFANGMQASGVIKTDAVLDDEQRKKFEQQLATFGNSTRLGKLILLEDGMEFQGISINPEAAQMLQVRAFNVEEICRWFRVPPFMVGHMDKASSWASSVEAQNLHFLTNTLRPILKNIEDEMVRSLVPREQWGEIYVEFGVEGLLRADSAGRAAYYNSLLQNGVLNRNEVRELENRGPIDGGDIYTVQLNLTPLGLLGKQVSPAAATAAAAAATEAYLAALAQPQLVEA